jgi:hypothetical protein
LPFDEGYESVDKRKWAVPGASKVPSSTMLQCSSQSLNHNCSTGALASTRLAKSCPSRAQFTGVESSALRDTTSFPQHPLEFCCTLSSGMRTTGPRRSAVSTLTQQRRNSTRVWSQTIHIQRLLEHYVRVPLRLNVLDTSSFDDREYARDGTYRVGYPPGEGMPATG